MNNMSVVAGCGEGSEAMLGHEVLPWVRGGSSPWGEASASVGIVVSKGQKGKRKKNKSKQAHNKVGLIYYVHSRQKVGASKS